MPVEIERKFIAHPSVLALCQSGTRFVQGYLYTDDANTIRIRQAEDRTLITWKSPRRGACRDEIEFAIEPRDGVALLARVPAGRRLEKTRYRVEHAGATWDVNVFGGALSGLILAEIELDREDQPVVLPLWIDREGHGGRALPQFASGRGHASGAPGGVTERPGSAPPF